MDMVKHQAEFTISVHPDGMRWCNNIGVACND